MIEFVKKLVKPVLVLVQVVPESVLMYTPPPDVVELEVASQEDANNEYLGVLVVPVFNTLMSFILNPANAEICVQVVPASVDFHSPLVDVAAFSESVL